MFGNARARSSRRLTKLSHEMADLRARLAVLEEQVGFLGQVESDAATDSVVADNHVSSRDHRTARSDLDRARRERDEVAARLADRKAVQDRLLEQLLE